MQDAAKIIQDGGQLSQTSFPGKDWHQATVPGTVLTTLVNNKIYPEPLYGENNRPDKIPESLCRTDWWYRGTFPVPADYAGKTIWLNLDGINYAAEIWINGQHTGSIKGAFTRGAFDVTPHVKPGKPAAIAIRISPQPHPGIPAEHTLGAGNGPIGGITRLDGPTFACSIGWDWMPGIRDRNTGIWQKVYWSATGPVILKDPQITTQLPLPKTDSADITVVVPVKNTSDKPQTGAIKGSFDNITFEMPVTLEPGISAQHFTFDPKKFPQLRVPNPKLWWPNGLGEPNLHTLRLTFEIDGKISDTKDINFGIRTITYDEPDTKIPGTGPLSLSINGVRLFSKGGNWGMDEALKRIPRQRLEAFVRLHRDANLNMIRNWGGQSTSDDLYDLCDQYGILLWDEFFQFNSADPLDLQLYIDNVRDKILRYRNHPSIALWCARNEATPPKYLDDATRGAVTALDPGRWYQSNSGHGRGMNSGGPYNWQTPAELYQFNTQERFNKNETFKTEIGGISVPTLESIQGMMPQSSWNTINDDWAEHDFTAGSGRKYPGQINQRYGKIANLPDFVRKAQMMNYESYRAMYEGRQGQMFNPVQGLLTWMSHPAQPSFVWQIYHHDLEPFATFFAVKKACEPIHIQFNESENGIVQIINNLPAALSGAHAKITLYNLDSGIAWQHDYNVNAPATSATNLGPVEWPPALTPVHFIKLELRDSGDNPLSDNFYWHTTKPDTLKELADYTALNNLPPVTLETKTARRDNGDKVFLDITLRNPGNTIALMTHLQLRHGKTQQRILPAYYSDNYISLTPKEEKTITIEAPAADLKDAPALILVDGWNITVQPVNNPGITLAPNTNAQIDNWPKTGLDFHQPEPLTGEEIRVNVGGFTRDGFVGDPGYPAGTPGWMTDPIEMKGQHLAPMPIYQTVRWAEYQYPFILKGNPGQTYTVRLHFTESDGNTKEGKRVFNISINGKTVLTDFDIYKESGGKNNALAKQFTNIKPEPGGKITIGIDKGKTGTPALSGIEILKE
jgi:hypothetical protein